MRPIDEVCPKANGVIRIVDASTLWIKTDKMSDDYIKRSDAIKALRKLGHEVVVIDKVCSLGVAAEFIDAIRDIPSADLNAEFAEWAKLWFKKELEADRPQGEWIVNTRNYKSVCSVCGANETDFIYGTEIWYGLGESKFCPNCGARMTTYSLAVALAKLLEEEGITDEELEQIIHDAKEEAQKEIARMKGADDDIDNV